MPKRKVKEQVRMCEQCHKQPAIVGFGEQARWLCQECFDITLTNVGNIKQLWDNYFGTPKGN